MKPEQRMRLEILDDIVAERLRQDSLKKEGRFTHTAADDGLLDSQRLVIVAEEVGELAGAVSANESISNDRKADGRDDIRKELIQISAVCLAWLERFECP